MLLLPVTEHLALKLSLSLSVTMLLSRDWDSNIRHSTYARRNLYKLFGQKYFVKMEGFLNIQNTMKINSYLKRKDYNQDAEPILLKNISLPLISWKNIIILSKHLGLEKKMIAFQY